METTTALLIAIPVLVVLAGVLLFATARRRDTGEAIGALARETRKRDRGSVAVLDQRGRRARHRPRGRAGRRARAPRGLQGTGHRRRHGAGGLGPARPGDARRHPPPVLQPGHRHVLRPRPLRLRRRLHRLPVAAARRGLRRRDHRRQHRRRRQQDRRGPRLRLLPRGPHVGHRVPGRRARRRRGPSTRRPSSPAWRPGSPRSTRSACTSAAACRSARPRSGSSARATARSTTGTARRRAARPRVASTASRSTVVQRHRHRRHRRPIIPGPPIGTNTTGQEAEGPHCVGAGEH